MRSITWFFSMIFAVILCIGTASAQTFPDRPITVIVPYSAGGPSDVIVRALGQEVAKVTGQSVVVENRPGGGTVIGSQAMLNQAADGYTLGLAGGSFLIVPRLLSKAPYDAQRDVSPVTQLFANPHVLVVSPQISVHTLQEFIAWAQQHAGQRTYSSFGIGSSGHLGFERFKAAANIDLLHIPYKGAAPATAAVLAGEVDATFGDVGAVLPHIMSGKLRAIAVAGNARSPALPTVPTFTQAGMPDFVSQTWIGLVTKAGVAPERIARLNQLFTAALAQPSVQAILENFGLEARPTTAQAFAQFMHQEDTHYARIIRNAGIMLE